MKNSIEMHVRFCGDERVLRIVHEEGRMLHASLLVPGKLDLMTGKDVARAPRGTKLPVVEFYEPNCRKPYIMLEWPQETAGSMGIWDLIASRGAYIEDGRIGVI